MAIDLGSEQVVSFAEATSLLPRRRAGKKPNVATIYRWSQLGLKGLRLEYVQVGATRCTSQEALQRFFDRLTAHAEAEQTAPPAKSAKSIPPSRQRQIDAAEKRLAAQGM